MVVTSKLRNAFTVRICPSFYYHSICLSHIFLKRIAWSILPQLAAKWVKEHHKEANAPNSVLFRVCDALKYVERW
jgi:hypothetical protein